MSEDDAPVDLWDGLADEQIEVLRRRYQEARRAGLTIVEARLFSESDADVGTLRRMVALKATPQQIAAVVL